MRHEAPVMMNRRVRAYLLPRAAGRAPMKQKHAAKCLIGAPAGAPIRHHCARSAMFPATVRPGDVGTGTYERWNASFHWSPRITDAAEGQSDFALRVLAGVVRPMVQNSHASSRPGAAMAGKPTTTRVLRPSPSWARPKVPPPLVGGASSVVVPFRAPTRSATLGARTRFLPRFFARQLASAVVRMY